MKHWWSSSLTGVTELYNTDTIVGACRNCKVLCAGGQVRFTNEQTADLEKKFDSQKYLSPAERKKLAKTLQLSERQVRAADDEWRQWRVVAVFYDVQHRKNTAIKMSLYFLNCTRKK